MSWPNHSSQEPWTSFFDMIAPDYTSPKKDKMWRIIDQIDQEITEALEKRLAQEAFFLTADSATSRGHGLVSFDVCNVQDEVFQLATVHAGYAQQTADFLKGHLRKQIDRIPFLCGLSQDTARNCRKAFREVTQELTHEGRLGWCKVSYIDCGEHVAQLINQDICSRLPWAKDTGSSGYCCGNFWLIFCGASVAIE